MSMGLDGNGKRISFRPGKDVFSMAVHFSDADISAARVTDLYGFLLARHADGVIKQGKSLRFVCNHSVSVKQGFTAYKDFKDGSHGNSVDCLVRFFGYDFPDAVAALLDYRKSLNQ